MASETSIVNSALRKLGVERVVSLTAGNKRARVCGEVYPRLRDDELRRHVWNFAKAKAQLAKTSTAPVSGYDTAYELPADFIRVVGVWGDKIENYAPAYEIVRNTIQCDVSEMFLTYIRLVTDTNLMDALFRGALAYRIAMETALALEGTEVARTVLERGYTSRIIGARSVDAIEDYPERMPDSPWITRRATGTMSGWMVSG